MDANRAVTLFFIVAHFFAPAANASPGRPGKTQSPAPPPQMLAATPAPAVSPSPPRQLRRRPLLITDANATEVPEVLVAAGVPTTLVFRTELDSTSIILADTSGAFPEKVRVTPYSVLLTPSADLPPTAVATLQLRLKDGTLLPFLLRTALPVVDLHVDVDVQLQEKATPESAPVLRAALEQARSELEECRAGSAEVAVGKIAALIGAEPSGPQVFERHDIRKIDKQHRLYVHAQQVYRMFGYTYLTLSIEGRGLPSSWTLGAVTVALAGSAQPQSLRTDAVHAEPSTIGPTDTMRVVVAFRPPPNVAVDTRFAITLSESNGTRHIRLDDVRL